MSHWKFLERANKKQRSFYPLLRYQIHLPTTIMATSSESQDSSLPKGGAQPLLDDGEYNLEDDEDEYPHLFQSLRTPSGLEVGVRVTWPGTKPVELSTCLPSDEIAPMFHGTQW